MDYSVRILNIEKEFLENNFEEILYDEEFLDENDNFQECYFCESNNILILENEYCKFNNDLKMKIKQIIKSIKYHEKIIVEICDDCGSILRIITENKEKYYNKNNLN